MGLGSLERRIDLVLHKSKATTVKFLREHLLAESAYTNQIVDDPRKASRFVEQHPRPVAEVLGEDMTKFEQWREAQAQDGHHETLSIDEYLKLPIIKKRNQLSFHNTYSFLKKVGQLSTGPDWICEIV
ncbi:hypothetical protein LshimejAT787_1104690 [Lyophyllum shimeji]|uniref:Uncharacterized protein n=1 Tax=Lyophyllum shimeji TaxID=47721 RepID=A0A9P3PVR3_LYOSH|nr:hypothetical protein LshimejAT787_1104690 [Lyophyllum shimeji]